MIFRALKNTQKLSRSIRALYLTCASPFDHAFILPPFPCITRAYISLGNLSTQNPTLMQQTINRFVLRAPMRMYSTLNCLSSTSLEQGFGNMAVFEQWHSLRLSTSHQTPENLDLPNVTHLSICIVGIPGTPDRNTNLTIKASHLRVAHLLLTDTRSVAFHDSALPLTIEYIVISTPHPSFMPLDVPSFLQGSDLCCTHHNIITHLPQVKEAVVALHGLRQLRNWHQRIS